VGRSYTASRAGVLDDVVVSVTAVRYDASTAAVRVDLRQEALEDKPYVDLGVRDAIWLAQAILRAAEQLLDREDDAAAQAPDA
jgi:hypothetical protein